MPPVADADLINAALDIPGSAPEFGYRLIAEELADCGISVGRDPTAADLDAAPTQTRPAAPARAAGARRTRRAPLHRNGSESAVVDRITEHRTARASSTLRDQGRVSHPIVGYLID
jgi:hypothetical protein